ncbi:MAG: hypothetical protein RJA22_2806 [Verrucomicrobiota bacterium]
MHRQLLTLIAALSLLATQAPAQVPQIIAYQGRITVSGTNFTGLGLFKFALVNSNGTASFWSNDGTSAAGAAPANPVTVPTTNGLYSVLLGDTTVPGMVTVPAAVFTNTDVRLRIWFSNGASYQQLAPDQRIAAVGYALMAASVNNGAITAAKLADGAVTTAKLADGSVTAAKFAPGSVNGTTLATSLSIGTTNFSGTVNIYGTLADTAGVTLSGGTSQISTYGADGLEQIRLWGASYGEVLLNDLTGNDTTVQLSANSNNGGSLTLNHSNSAIRALLTSSATAGELLLYSTNSSARVALHGGSGGSYLNLYTADGSSGLYLDGDSSGYGFIGVRNTNSQNRVSIAGQGLNGGGQATLYAADGSTTVQVLADDGTGAGNIKVNNNISQTRVSILGEGSGTGGEILLSDADGTATIELSAAEGLSSGSTLKMRDLDGILRAELDGDYFGGASLILYGTNNLANIVLSSSSSGEGRITCDVLEINGGSDLSEKFDINPAPAAGGHPGQAASPGPEPGMIVCIDPANPGQLVTSSRAYDRTVAGIISGAGGVKPGMLMGQAGTAADGRQPVALTGRVYCRVDADQGAILPGDLITTSPTPGHGMKVTDHTRAQGAVIGKAMTPLPRGQGLVLVLVSLQ